MMTVLTLMVILMITHIQIWDHMETAVLETVDVVAGEIVVVAVMVEAGVVGIKEYATKSRKWSVS